MSKDRDLLVYCSWAAVLQFVLIFTESLLKNLLNFLFEAILKLTLETDFDFVQVTNGLTSTADESIQAVIALSHQGHHSIIQLFSMHL